MTLTSQPLRHNPLIIADVSRFAHGKHKSYVRSRNASPLDHYHTDHQPPTGTHGNVYGIELLPGLLELQDIPNTHLLPSSSLMPPYPPNALAMNASSQAPPQAPPKNDQYYGHRHILQPFRGTDLPAVQDLRDFMANQKLLMEKSRRYPSGIMETTQQPVVNSLVDRVMNKPLARLGPKQISNDNSSREDLRSYVISSSTLFEVLQVLFSIVVLTLSSVLSSSDSRVGISVYRFFIAASVMSLVVALLFVSKTLKYERRNSAVFCALVCIFTGVALVLAITTFASNSDCLTGQICSMRKGLATITILSFLLWMCTSIVYITTLYISHMEGYSSPPLYNASSFTESEPTTPRKSTLPLYYQPKKQDLFP